MVRAALLGIKTFHGLTMMPFWSDWVIAIARAVGETGRPTRASR